MRQGKSILIAVLGVAIVSVGGLASSAQQTTTSTDVKAFEVVSVEGNKVVVKSEAGAQEITVPDDFRLTVDGRPVSVRELKAGMKGTARITTATTVTPVTVTEIKKGKVVGVTGNSIIVRTEEGIKMFSEADVTKRGVKINRPDGSPITFSDLREGYDLSATIVTQKPPQVMTEREVEAALASVPAPAASLPAPAASLPAPAASPTPAPGPAPGVTTPSARTELPKTASRLPLIGLLGIAALGVAGLLMARRRRAFRPDAS